MLFLFFCSQLFYELVTEPFYLWLHDYYQIPYLIGTALILIFGLWIVWDNLPQKTLKLLAIPGVISLTVARITYLGSTQPLDSTDWKILAQGACLLFLGQSLTASATYAMRNHTALLILGITWLAQAAFLDGYLLHDSWLSLGWVPAVIVGTGFFLVGATLPHPSRLG